MCRANQDIRDTALHCGVKHWEIAEKIGKTEQWLCKKLRTELPEEEKFKIFAIIGEIAKEKEA